MWRAIVRSSSFWAGTLTVCGAILVPLKVVSQETWETIAKIAAGYIAVRVSGDTAKKLVANSSGVKDPPFGD